MTQTMMFELEARDEALSRVAENAGDEWREQVRGIVRGMDGREVTGEDIRLACSAQQVGPHHPNAWGAVINVFIRSGLLVPTGRYVPMKASGSHARKTQVYLVERKELH